MIITIPCGVKVEIIIIDDHKPELVAMLQALYSRDPRSVVEHLDQVKTKGADKFMSTYYVGYGHKSIGDCGTTSIFIENVSILAAKAIQDTPLYNGQEASTRYLDMSKQEVLNPLGTEEGTALQKDWMRLYITATTTLIKDLPSRYPRKHDEKESVWEKAIRARAFDIARSLLPAGVTTYVSWHTNLRQAYDHFQELKAHPLEEIRVVGQQIEYKLRNKYPSSFSHSDNSERDIYLLKSMEKFAFSPDRTIHEFECDMSRLDIIGLQRYTDLLESRPPRTELHQRFRTFGTITFKFPLDFGSYRDLQRQRSAVQLMPLLTPYDGMHSWYTTQFSDDINKQILKLLQRTENLQTSPVIRQYYTPLGCIVPVTLTCTLPSAVYIAELRSGQTVHPTLRIMAQEMGKALRTIPGLTMHFDPTPDEWSIKRGLQDIVKKT